MIRKILMGLAAVVGFTTVATAATPELVWEGNSATTTKTLSSAVEKGKPFTLIVHMTNTTSATAGSYIIGKIGAGQTITPFCVAADEYTSFTTGGAIPNNSVSYDEKKSGGWWCGVGSRSASGSASWKEEKAGDEVSKLNSIYVAYSGTVDADGVVSDYVRMIFAHRTSGVDYTLSTTSASLTISDSLDTMNVNSAVDTLAFKVYLDYTARTVDEIKKTISEMESPSVKYATEVKGDMTWSAIKEDLEVEGDFPENSQITLTINAEETPTITFDTVDALKGELAFLKIEGTCKIAYPEEEYTDGCWAKTLFTAALIEAEDAEGVLKSGFSGAWTLGPTEIALHAQNREVISINVAGGKISAGGSYPPEPSPTANMVPDDDNYYGIAPTQGKTWNNIDKKWKNYSTTVTLKGSKASAADGTIVQRPTIDLSATAGTTWQADSITNPFLRGYLDDGEGVQVAVHGVPYTKYDVIVYVTSDSNLQLAPVTINGTTYTYVDGELVKGNTPWGVGLQATPEIGKNAIYIKDCSGEQLTINTSARQSGSSLPRGTVCAVQVINQGEVLIRHEYYGEMCGDVCFTDGEEDENLEKLGDPWENGPLNTITISNTAENATFSFGALTEGQQIKFVSDYPMTLDAASMVEYGKLGIYDFTEVTGGVTITLPEEEAFDPSTLPTTIKGDWKFSKNGILVFNGKLPPDSYKTFLTNETDWAGTVWIKNYTVAGQVFNEYGNANSTLRFTGVKGWFDYNNTETTMPIELVDEGETRALEVTDGSTNRAYIFDKITGEGSVNVSSVHSNDAFVVQIKDVSEYTGKITSLDSTTPYGKHTQAFPILIGELGEGGKLPYGTNSCITVADGATINTGCGWQAESAKFGATINAPECEAGQTIISGLKMQTPVYLATKVAILDDFFALRYYNSGNSGKIDIEIAESFEIKDCLNATFAVEGAFEEGGYWYAADGAPLRVTYTTVEGFFFSDGSTTKVIETTVTDDMDPIEAGDEAKKYVAKIDDTCYESLNDAFAAVDDNGKTIVMLNDTAITNGIDLVWDYAWSTTLDMNGKTITHGYQPASADVYVPMFNVSSNATLTIKGNGTITGWEGGVAAGFDSKGVIVVDGGWLMFKNGTLTAGGQDDKGMYGVAVFGNGTAYFGEQDVVGGPTITTWFAPIGASNQNPGDKGVEIIVYDGAYTQLATPAEEGAWWSHFCAAIHAQADGTYDIKGGAFTGALYSVSTPYENVDQDINFYGGTFEKPLFVGEETGKHPCAEPSRDIWKNPKAEPAIKLDVVPDGYAWSSETGYLIKAVCALVKAIGTEFYYDSVEKAFELATDGDTVKLLQDATITNGIDLVYDGGYYWYVTFDLNGKTLSPAYTPTAENYKPMFNVSSNAYLTVTDSSDAKGGTIEGWEGETAADLDGNTIVRVDGGFFYFEKGALTAGGVDGNGLYGVYILGSGSAWFGETNKTGNATGTGPTITTWFAPIAANNLTPGKLGVQVKVYGGKYTQEANGVGQDWASLCAAIYAPAVGTYDIYGGSFKGTVGSISSPFKNVDQDINLYAGEFVNPLYVTEEQGEGGVGYRNIWKSLEDPTFVVNVPKGYCWDTFGYLQHGVARNAYLDTYYPSLQEAFNGAGNSQTIEMLQDIVLTNGIDFVYDAGYPWYTTLDMMGHKLTAQYDREKATNKPVFNVSSNAFVTITGNGTIEGWTGAAATNYDGKAVIDVDGGFLYYLNGTLTAGGEGEWGMYGVNVCGSGTAKFGADGVTGGPTITTWFAPIGANNMNPGTLGVDITVYDGTYTQLADGTGKWWSYFCAAIYAPANGKYDIKGGTFKGALYCLSTRYANVDQDIWFYGGDFQSPLFVGEEKGKHPCETPSRDIWKNLDEVELDAPEGYYWDADGYLQKSAPTPGPEPEPGTKVDPVPGEPGTYIVEPTGEETGLEVTGVKSTDTLIITNTTVTSLTVDNKSATIKVTNKGGDAYITGAVYGWDEPKLKLSTSSVNETYEFSTELDPSKVGLEVTGITVDKNVDVPVKSFPGLTYTLVRTETIGGDPTDVTSVVATEKTTTLQDTEKPTGQAFYKVQATK